MRGFAMTTERTIPAVGYARRSTDLQERSILDQKAAVERWANANGHHVLRWYVDDAISGTSARGRGQFEKLLRAAENGRDFDAVLCYDMSRFSRGGTNETGYYLHRLRLAGVQTHFTAEGIPDGDEGELLQGVKSWQARQYSVKLSRDCIRGQHSTVTARHSAMGGRAPYGYDRQYVTPAGQVLKTVRTLRDGRRQEFDADGKLLRTIDAGEKPAKKMKSDIARLVPGDTKQVEAVRTIFEMCAKGYGFRSIAITLNKRGVPGPTLARWNAIAVKTILQNPSYRGALAWNRHTFGKIHEVASDGTPIPKKTSRRARNPSDRWIIVEKVHPPLVTASLFAKAQEQMSTRRDKGGLARPTQRYLLSGLLRCTNCGLNMWGCVHKKPGYEMRYYTDAGYRAHGPTRCKATHIQIDALDRWVLGQLRDALLGDTATLNRAVDQFIAAVSVCEASRPRPDQQRELEDLDKRIRATVNLLADGDLDDVDELHRVLVDLKSRRRALVPAAVSTAAVPPDAKRLRVWAHEKIASLHESLRPGTPTLELKKVVHEFVDRIEIDPIRRVGTLWLPRDTFAALQSSFSRRDRSESSIHSCTVLVAGRLASPR